jgi:hypothetical protein
MKGTNMGMQQLASTRRNYVVALARNREHAEAVVMDLAYKGLPVAHFEIPTDTDLCGLCGPARKAPKLGFIMGALTATAVWIALFVAVVIVRQLF